MKNLLLVLTGALLLLMGGCTKDPATGSGQGEVTVNLTASLPTAIQSYSTKASNQGGINNVTDKTLRYILEVYDESGNFTMRKTVFKAPGAFTDPASFSLTLLAQKYKFAFWADFVASEADADLYYSTLSATDHGLQAVALKTALYAINDEARDAYTATLDADLSSSSLNRTVTLKRPFGKIRLLATDLAAAASQGYTPTQTSIAYTVELPTTFNALTGAAQASPTAQPSATAAILDEDVTGGKVVALDYVFAGVKPTVSLTFSASGTGGTTERAIETIPVEANKLTTVKGALFTRGANLSVSVSDEFNEPGNEMELTEVNSIDEVAAALSGGDQMLVVKDEVQESKSIDFSAASTPYQGTETVAVTLNAVASGAAVTFQATADAPKNLAITMPEGHSVTLNMPNTTVTLNGRHYSSVDAITATSTLIVPRDVTVENLTLRQGNVKIYGVVDNVTKVGGYADKLIRCVASQADLDRALADDKSGYDYLLIEQPVSGLDAKGATLAAPLEIAANAELSNLTIDAPAGNGITLAADNINVVLDGVTVRQNEADVNAARNCAILAAGYNNLTLLVKNSDLIVPKANQRGVNIHGAKDAASVCRVTLDNTHIGPQPRSGDPGNVAYTPEQNTAFKKMFDSRGIGIGAHAGNIIVRLQNKSVVEGVFYVFNATQHSDKFEVYVDDSRLDGRCAFNLWSDGGSVINVTNGSELIGRNPFPGPTEIFATIVVCEKDDNWAGAANHVITVKDSRIYSYNDPETDTNIQYAAQLRSPRKNVLNLRGTTAIYDQSATKRLPYAVQVQNWINEVNVDQSVTLEGGTDATILPPVVWDGTSYASPGKAADGKYYIGEPSELAGWVKQKTGGDAVLVRDLDLNNKAWPVSTETTAITGSFDGCSHTVSNLKCQTYAVEADGEQGVAYDNKKQNAGLFGCFKGTLKNLTIDGAEIYGSRSGALVGRFDGGTVTNCHVANVEVTGGAQKVAPFIGYVSNNGGDGVFSNCSVTNSSVEADSNMPVGDGTCQAGGFIGYLQAIDRNVTFENNRVEGVTVTSGGLWEDQPEAASHVFVGNLINLSKTEKTICKFTGNSVTNCSLKNAAVMSWATEFFGFYYTAPQQPKFPIVNTVIVDGKTLVE